ncbi:unnamed protein product [Urochloa decumbens]|uniref:F-box associated beta-propeller type 3 domain-containing protein n=1 Tax=Urochloa decumbens TaxID=240449 RepID=A0ABC9FEL3_9POAL
MASSETMEVQTGKKCQWVPSLPDEMIELIFVRLPVSTLLRCRRYKVIHFLGERELFSIDTFIVIQVYTLGDDKWRDLRAPKSQRLDCIDYFGVLNVDGAMYWLTEDKWKRWRRSVVSFDLSEERFEWIQMPIADPDHADRSTNQSRMYWITEVDGKVCVATAQHSMYSAIGFVGNLEIWTLENKANQSWRQKCAIQFSSVDICIPRPHFIHGDKIILYGQDRNVYYQKLMGQNIKIEKRKMVKLLNYSPRWYSNMQSLMQVHVRWAWTSIRCCSIHQSKNQFNWVEQMRVREMLNTSLKRLESILKTSDLIQSKIIRGADQHRLNWVELKQVQEILNAKTKD